MRKRDIVSLRKGLKLISMDLGILSYISKLPYFNNDPKLQAFGIWPCDTTKLGALRYGGRSSGCGYTWEESALSTIGEVVERYCPAFYNSKDFIKSSYNDLNKKAIHPGEVALFHEKQYANFNFPFVPFTEDHPIHWAPCIDMVTAEEVWYPGSLIYMPWIEKEEFIGLSTSTGLAGHTDLYEGILIALYEIIERDSFVITWMQQLDAPKIEITPDIRGFLDANYPSNYEFHYFDITFDLQVPSVMGICFGEADFGKFVAFGSATRGTMSEALQKVTKEMGQTISYFRYLLGEKKDWYPYNFEDLHNFEAHSIFYIKRQDLWHVFDNWRNAKPSTTINFHEQRTNTTTEEIKKILRILDGKNYNVLLKVLTTPDVQQAGFHSLKVICPQLVQLSGSYQYYFSGGRRLYEVPEMMGYKAKSFDELNKYPHPFP